MILAGLGANLPSPYGPPASSLPAALAALEGRGVRVLARSRFYQSPAWPPSDQPDYVNAVASLETALSAADLLSLFHEIERAFGRVRSVPNAARPLDLDLLDYHDLVRAADPALPHSRLALRAFVLLPMAEIAPQWRHPVTQQPIADLIARLPSGQGTRLL
ncbi:MAG: 2-amino-4-hydroxy-6-hydroxymethyldihydropteridine diphosphokinase [Rhodospirillales bacterium]|nr:2-amino-4-hydroxy-6-hydroxymethyldihydropteridine diphosphokinase [Rhodospirillales bacterium]